jgi:hypothetical protein
VWRRRNSAYASCRADGIACVPIWHSAVSRAALALIVELYDAHNAGMIDVEAGAGERRFGSTSLREVFREIVPRMMAMHNASVRGEQL